MEQQLRRYFIGIMSFAFVVTWASAGMMEAFFGLVVCLVAVTSVPALENAARGHGGDRRRKAHVPRRRQAPRRVVTARPLVEEDAEELPLVPDEPSLIITASG